MTMDRGRLTIVYGLKQNLPSTQWDGRETSRGTTHVDSMNPLCADNYRPPA